MSEDNRKTSQSFKRGASQGDWKSGSAGRTGTSGRSGGGYAGKSGSNGYAKKSGTGYAGKSGSDGYAGKTGSEGYAGKTGTGYAGKSGTDGYAGKSGTGYAGKSGTGYAGKSGTGYAGKSGTGYAGKSGTGYTGKSGTGYAGKSGTGYAGRSESPETANKEVERKSDYTYGANKSSSYRPTTDRDMRGKSYSSQDRDQRPGQDRDQRSYQGREQRPGQDRDQRSYQGREQRPGQERDQRSYQGREQRPGQDRDQRSYQGRDQRPGQDRDQRSYQGRDQRPGQDRDQRSYQGRDQRPGQDRDQRSYQGREQRPGQDRDQRSYQGREQRPGQDREQRSYQDREQRSYQDREQRSYQGRDQRPGQDRDQRSYQGRDQRPGQDREQRSGQDRDQKFAQGKKKSEFSRDQKSGLETNSEQASDSKGSSKYEDNRTSMKTYDNESNEYSAQSLKENRRSPQGNNRFGDKDNRRMDRNTNRGTFREGTCPHIRECGGCQMLQQSYDAHLKEKQVFVETLIKKFCRVEPIIGMEQPKYYRNKVHVVFDHDRKGNPLSGVYEEGTHRVIPIENCLIHNQKADAIIASIRGMLKSFKIKTYDEDSDRGLMRHVLIRTGFNSGEIMVVLVLSTPILPSKNNFVKALREQHPEITTIVVNVNDKKTSMILGEKEQVIYGKGYIEDSLSGKVFRISPKSFYQVNPVQAEVIYRKAIELADLKGTETIIDAYCGIGTIGLLASDHVKKVIGVELNKDAVRDAIMNAKRNEASNIEFFKNDAGEFMSHMAEQNETVDVVFLDPPRSGSTEQFMDAVALLKPKKVVYVSCNLVTLDRDLQYLTTKGYKAVQAIPVDMFPWTSHVETIVGLHRRDT